jgi:hypothetical protein
MCPLVGLAPVMLQTLDINLRLEKSQEHGTRLRAGQERKQLRWETQVEAQMPGTSAPGSRMRVKYSDSYSFTEGDPQTCSQRLDRESVRPAEENRPGKNLVKATEHFSAGHELVKEVRPVRDGIFSNGPFLRQHGQCSQRSIDLIDCMIMRET